METWIPLISEYGFPVMVTLYLLHRIEKKLDLLNETMLQIATIFNQSSLYENGPKQYKNNA